MNLTTDRLEPLSVCEFAADESGVTAIEYGLLAALISVVIITAVSQVGTTLNAIYVMWSTAVITAILGAL